MMRCPTCRKATTYERNPFRPFCSERCKIIDLGKWAAGVYRLPTQETARDETGGDLRDQGSER